MRRTNSSRPVEWQPSCLSRRRRAQSKTEEKLEISVAKKASATLRAQPISQQQAHANRKTTHHSQHTHTCAAAPTSFCARPRTPHPHTLSPLRPLHPVGSAATIAIAGANSHAEPPSPGQHRLTAKARQHPCRSHSHIKQRMIKCIGRWVQNRAFFLFSFPH